MNSLKKSLGTLFPAMRLSFALVLLTVSILLTAELLNFTPKENKFLIDSRTKISESLAIQVSMLIKDKSVKKIQNLISYIVKRNPDILSAGIRLSSGDLIFQTSNHSRLWDDYNNKNSTTSHVLVPIIEDKHLWGNVELRFKALKGETFLSFFKLPIFKLIIFVSIIGFFVYLVFMLRTLRQLDPTSVIPERVNAAFDSFTEGVIIIDEKQQILLANKSFCDKIEVPDNSLMGTKVSEFKWKNSSEQRKDSLLAWERVLKSGKKVIGEQLIFEKSKDKLIKFAINASPILGDKKKIHGVMITLDDISLLEQHNKELKTVVSRLHKSQYKIKQQNKELAYLATRDSLTGCLNRRSFSEQFDKLFEQALTHNKELSCIMVDIDHFKLVNDNYGHATGDLIIKLLAEILKSSTRKDDLVARYGGEEFCMVLPGMPIDVAYNIAEQIRYKVKNESARRYVNGPRITVSLGIASIYDKPETASDLNNLADKALYVAKESGRNKVVKWQPDIESNESKELITTSNKENGKTSKEHVEHLHKRIKELEEIASNFSNQLDYQQNYDSLTGLPNQILFYDRIYQSIERGYRFNQLSAVLIIDIEKFSQINTSLGRSIGDQLLQEFAERLNSIFRRYDGISRLTISRFAGDEFAVLLTDLTQQDQVTWAVKRLLETINESIEIENNMIHINAQIGVSIYPTDANTVDELLNHAMTAKKYCKNYKNQFNYQFYDQHMQDLSIKYLQLDMEIREAIENQQWLLLYQPKIDLNRNVIIGAEALIRWRHPQRGVLSPFEFIDFAEQQKLIVPIGDWVIQEACKQIRRLMSQGINNCKVAVNLSSVQLIQSDIVEKVFSTLEKFNIPPRLFEIEVTETALIDNINIAAESLKRLSARGIEISIDDFGTGYSSLNYLKKLPISSLKIDRSFIMDICKDDNDQQIVQALISMAHSLDLTVIAEGVEDKEQLAMLNSYGCDEIQGYLFSKPVTPDKLVKLINNNTKTL